MSQVTLPSTEGPGSPVDPSSSFKTEFNDDTNPATVIPSSLTPPPSSQIAAPPKRSSVTNLQSQQSTLASPPATIQAPARERAVGISTAEYVVPAPNQVLHASTDELRAMLQTCISQHQKLKMEMAHHKLQLNLMNMQAEEESKRAAVEHDMVRREVDALRMAEHSRQARRELSSSADSMQSKYLQTKAWYDSAMEENDTLHQRLRMAKKVIQQKEDETVGLVEERNVLLTRIRENREHFHMLCSPGGIFYGALTPKQQTQLSTPRHQHARSAAAAHQPARGTDDRQEGGLSALLQAMSQDHHHNTSAPSTPKNQRSAGRRGSRHNRNAQSMSSLPSTPMHRTQRDAGLLPSIDLVPQTEPRMRYTDRFNFDARAQKQDGGRKSRESTISADDEEVARQALMSVREERRDESLYGSQASQAATEMLRRQTDTGDVRGGKRKFSGETGQSPKKAKQEQVGLGIH